jgi:tetratricopeptide (TPR) repeat protein
MSKKSTSALTERTPRMVGREEELKRLRQCLHARGDRHFIYYWANGGLGKTRLLEELLRMVADAGPGFYSTDTIDLYHTDTHSTSDVERAIVEGLDPERKYFARYRRERARYELLRERGTDPGVLEQRREELGQVFVKECRDMALDARKLVICFDTVELLQYESSTVEEMAGLDTADTRIKPWLLDKLAQLGNVLVVFAGRPKLPSPGEQTDPHAWLVADLKRAFGQDLTVVEMQSFTLAETQAFIKALTGESEVIPAQYLSVVHCLTSGRPIFLHLVVDLIQTLSPEPRTVLEMFDQYADLVNVPEDDERLAEARDRIERQILRGVFIDAAGFEGCLGDIALMPKGIDPEILHQTLGMPRDEAQQLMARLEPLSFTKRFKALPGAERLHSERVFFHDEMYQLLRKPGVMPNLRLSERKIAHALMMNYYDPRIMQLERDIKEHPPEERIPLRERLQKFQVERFYYLLAHDPRLGYEEYKRLSDQANRRRWVGYGMRLLDEFLRFYNVPERRKRFEAVGISHDQVVRESVQMWVERFHWWGQREREIQFVRRVLDQPEAFFIRPQENLAILGNICALWARARAVLYGYEPGVVKEAQEMLRHFPVLADCTSEQAQARARLSTSIGYQFRLGGLLAAAAAQYVDAKAAFRKLKGDPDELAMLLNNLAHVYALQGRMALARPLAHEALRIDEEMENEYSTGLTLSTLAGIARMRGNHPQAVAYGEEALALFRELEDAHGVVLSYLSISQAMRRMAKHEMEKGRKLKDARQMLEDVRRLLDQALEVAVEANLGSDILVLRAEQGRVYRDLGHAVRQLEGLEEGLVHYRQSERQLRQVLESAERGRMERADTLQDLAETLFFSVDQEAARQCLAEVEELIGPEHCIVPGEHVPGAELPHEYFAPLGKMEMTRGQMAFAQGELEEGLRHYVLGYAYFVRFSPDAVEKDTLLEYLYNRLRDLSVERQQALVASIRTWSQQYDIGVDIESFVQTLEDLLGV